MSLIELKRYIQLRQQVSLRELSWHFQEDPGLLQDMCQVLERKGAVCSRRLTPKCGKTCGDCSLAQTLIYSSSMLGATE